MPLQRVRSWFLPWAAILGAGCIAPNSSPEAIPEAGAQPPTRPADAPADVSQIGQPAAADSATTAPPPALPDAAADAAPPTNADAGATAPAPGTVVATKTIPMGPFASNAATVRGREVALTGTSWASASLDGTALTGEPEGDVLVAKLTVEGTLRWARSFGGPELDSGYDVSLDPAGNVLVTGRINSPSVDFDGHTVAGPPQFSFLAKLDGATGKTIWATQFGEDSVSAVGDGVLAAGRAGTGKYTADGTPVWRFPPSVAFAPRIILGAPDGAAAIAGDLSGSYTVGGATYAPQGPADVMVQKLDDAGQVKWALALGGPTEDWPGGLAIDGVGNVLVIGAFAESVAAGAMTRTSAGMGDVFVAKLSGLTGRPAWLTGLGSAGYDLPGQLAIGPGGNVWASASSAGKLNTPLTPAADGGFFVVELDGASGQVEVGYSLKATPLEGRSNFLGFDADGYLLTGANHAFVRLLTR